MTSPPRTPLTPAVWISVLLLSLCLTPRPVEAARSAGWEGEPGLEGAPGRNDVRVLSAPYPLVAGSTIAELALVERLDRLGYRRVRGQRPAASGEYFWGHEVFWIYRRAHVLDGKTYPARCIGLALEPDTGRIVGYLTPDGRGAPAPARTPWLEPEVLAESLTAGEGERVPVRLDELPDHVWQAVLAAEDHRFFDHGGVDARGVARALLRNALAGEVVQGGSTITQQLVKARDLNPQRTLGRKVSEAVRALALEAEFDKQEILESYLNHVYLGHLGGRAVRGVGAAARSYFGVRAEALDLGQAAVLAAMIQGPNRLDPTTHPERVLERQRWVLSRMEEQSWASEEQVAAERRRGLPRLDPQPPGAPSAPRFLSWVEAMVEGETERLDEGRGVIVETTLDPLLQAWAETAVMDGLDALRRERPSLRSRPLSAALVALDGASGEVLAHVGGDPRAAESGADAFDRVRQARRQPGSAVKPLVLLEAFDDCGRRDPVYPARRVADRPVVLDLPSGPWRPENSDGRYRGTVDLRQALVASLNVPFVRLGRWCGFDEVSGTFERAGLELPDDVPPSFVLGAIEVSPAELAGAYTAFVDYGVVHRPLPVRGIARPGGRRIARLEPRSERVASPPAAFLVRDLLRDAVTVGTARSATLDSLAAFGKTGTSSDRRDAWLVGGAGSVVAVVWVGVDDGSPLGFSGSTAAAPIWSAFMERAAPARPSFELPTPEEIVVLQVQDGTGLLVGRDRRGSHAELFDGRHLPRKRRLLLPDAPVDVIE